MRDSETCVYLATDQPPPEKEKGEPSLRDSLTWNSFGEKSDNLAFISASRKFNESSGKEEIFAEIANFSDESKDFNFQIGRDGKILFEKRYKANPSRFSSLDINFAGG